MRPRNENSKFPIDWENKNTFAACVAAIRAGSVFGKHVRSTAEGCRFESGPALHRRRGKAPNPFPFLSREAIAQ